MIIGLTGYAQSGKDTVAEYLVNNHGFKRVAFADKIRDLIYETNPMIGDGTYFLKVMVDAYGWDVLKQREDVRRLLQNVGVAARTVFGKDFWVNQAIVGLDTVNNSYVFTDVRFKNEVESLKRLGAEIWRIERPNVTAVNQHISETELSDYVPDRLLLNEGTIEELHKVVQIRMGDALSAN